MNLLLQVVLQNGFLLDIFGIIGIGLIGLAAIRLSKRFGGRSGLIMCLGALSLVLGRVGMLVFTHFVTPFNQASFHPALLSWGKTLPLVLLTLGLGAIVAGFWSHERETADELSLG